MDVNAPYGRMTRWMLRVIERHRQGPLGRANCCRFTPSCSHYAEELFRTRAFPLALVLAAARVIRCNPIAVRRATDPVRRAGRWRPRPNTLPTLFAVIGLSGLVVVLTATVAEAVGVTGGCVARINGQDPATMTYDSPLTVHKGQVVSVVGNVPANIEAAGGQINSETYIQVSFIEGVFSPKTETHSGTGPAWGGSKNVDNYLKYGVGLYKVIGVSSGQGWACTGEGYIKLKDGNPLSKPVGEAALALGVIGGAGALASTRSGASGEDAAAVEESSYSDEGYDPPTAEENRQALARAVNKVSDPSAGVASSAGCLALVVLACILASQTPHMVGAVAAGATPRARKSRVWRRGHPVLGFISGLLLGVGVAVLGQQFAIWPLTITTAIALPVVVAILCAVRAYMGKPLKTVVG